MDILNYFFLMTGQALIEDNDFKFWERLDAHFTEQQDVLKSLDQLRIDIESHSRMQAELRGITFPDFVARKNISERVAALETRTFSEVMLDFLMENYPDRATRLQLRGVTARLMTKRSEASKPRRKL